MRDLGQIHRDLNSITSKNNLLPHSYFITCAGPQETLGKVLEIGISRLPAISLGMLLCDGGVTNSVEHSEIWSSARIMVIIDELVLDFQTFQQ